MSVNCILLGAPGAGKGTQAQVLAGLWTVPHISTGAMLRDAVTAGTPLGRRVEPIMASGGLVADDLMLDVLAERLEQADALEGFILDGFPRTLRQARLLDRLVAVRGPLVVVNIVVPDAHIVGRLSLRGRADDGAEIVRQRLAVYHRETAPLVEHYSKRASCCSVDGTQTPDEVTSAIVRAVQHLRARSVQPRTAARRTIADPLPAS